MYIYLNKHIITYISIVSPIFNLSFQESFWNLFDAEIDGVKGSAKSRVLTNSFPVPLDDEGGGRGRFKHPGNASIGV